MDGAGVLVSNIVGLKYSPALYQLSNPAAHVNLSHTVYSGDNDVSVLNHFLPSKVLISYVSDLTMITISNMVILTRAEIC